MHQLVLISLLIATVSCATINVPWVYGMSPQRINVEPGDTLLWKWSNKYTVANCTVSEFTRCECSNIMASSSPFSWEAPDMEGTHFFASSVGSHCSDGGVKLVVIVSKESKQNFMTLNKRQAIQNNQDIYVQPSSDQVQQPSSNQDIYLQPSSDQVQQPSSGQDIYLQNPSPMANPTPMMTETPNPTPMMTETPNPTPMMTETPNPAPMMTETPNPAPMMTETPNPAPMMTDTPNPSPLPVVVPPTTPADLSLCYDSCYYAWYNLCQNLWYNLTMNNLMNPSYNFTTLCNQSTSFDLLTVTWTNWTNPWNLTDSTEIMAFNGSQNPCWNVWFNSTDSSTDSSTMMMMLDNSTQYANSSMMMLASPWSNTTSPWFNMTAFCQNPCALQNNPASDDMNMNPWNNYGDFFSNMSTSCWLNTSDYTWIMSWESSPLANTTTWSNFSSPCFGLWFQLCYVPWNNSNTDSGSSLPSRNSGDSTQPMTPVVTLTFNFTDNMTVCFNPCYYAWYHMCYQLWYNETALNVTNPLYNFTSICNNSISFSNLTSMWSNFSNPWVNVSSTWANLTWANLTQSNASLNWTLLDQPHPCWNTWYNTTEIPELVNITIPTNCTAEPNITSVWQNMTGPMFNLSSFCASPCYYFWNLTDETNTTMWSNYADYFLNSSSPCSNSTFNVSTANITQWHNVSSPCFSIWYELCYVPWNMSNSVSNHTNTTSHSNTTMAGNSTSGNSISRANSTVCSFPCFDLWYKVCYATNSTDVNSMMANVTQEWYNSTIFGACYNPWYNMTVGNSTEWCLSAKQNATNQFYDANKFLNYIEMCYSNVIQDAAGTIQQYLNNNNITMYSSGVVQTVSAVTVIVGSMILLLL